MRDGMILFSFISFDHFKITVSSISKIASTASKRNEIHNLGKKSIHARESSKMHRGQEKSVY